MTKAFLTFLVANISFSILFAVPFSIPFPLTIIRTQGLVLKVPHLRWLGEGRTKG